MSTISYASEKSHTKIDILKDSVSNIMDKLFYEATDGKTIDYAWDAPQPACVNPLKPKEIAEWGETAMTITYVRVAKNPTRLGRYPVSNMSGFAQRATTEPFHGYRSEPPKCAAYESIEPIGPVAKAVRAAGELAALAEKNGEDAEPVWELLKGSYGIDLGEMRHLVKPNLTKASEKDEIKFARPPTHMLYGFNSVAPAVTPNTGKYRPETMTKNIMFDWHAMLLTLRFIGETACRYSDEKFPVGSKSYYAPAYSEGRLFRRAIYSSNIVPITEVGNKTALSVAVDNTLKFIRGSAGRANVMMAIRHEARKLKIASDTPIDIETIRRVAGSMNGKTVRLPKNVHKEVPVPELGDVIEKRKPSFYDTVVNSALRSKVVTIPNWQRVSRMVLSSMFVNGFETAPVLISAMRKHKVLADMTHDQTVALCKTVATALPRGIGFTIYAVLARLLFSDREATYEFMKMICLFSGKEVVEMSTSYDEALVNAIATSQNVNSVLWWIQSAHSCRSAHVHGISRILRPLSKSDDLASAYHKSLYDFMNTRMHYWAEFYKSVVIDCRDKLKVLKQEAKRRKIPKTAAPRLSLVKTKDIYVEDLHILSDAGLIHEIEKAKEKMIKANFSAASYTKATVVVTDRFYVEISLSSSQLKEILLRQVDNYARKRSTWGKQLAKAPEYWAKKRDKFLILTRHHDMLDFVDEIFDPNVPWSDMYRDVNVKFRETANSVERMLKRNLTSNTENMSADHEEAVEEEKVKAVDYIFSSGNRYAALATVWDSSSSSDDSEDDDDKLARVVTIATGVKTDPNTRPIANLGDEQRPSDAPGLLTAVDSDYLAGLVRRPEVTQEGNLYEESELGLGLFERPEVIEDIERSDNEFDIEDDEALLSLMDAFEMPTSKFNEAGFSLRDTIQTTMGIPFNGIVFRKFMKSRNNGMFDYFGTREEISTEMEAYLDFYAAASESSAAESKTIRELDEGNFDIA